MDIAKITKNTKARKSREAKPIRAFLDLLNSTNSALEEVSDLGASDTTKETLLKGHIINTVTAVEVYYRDMLDSVFRLCNPSSFNEKLNKLHDKNYKIDDLIELYVNRVHPLELVASSLSFQNIQSIDKVFSTLIGKPFFKQAKKLKWRLAKKPESEFEITHEDINTLQEIFEERHQLIHNPSKHFELSEEIIMGKINSIFCVIMASDLVLTQFINENIDPELSSNKKIQRTQKDAPLI